MRLQFGFTSYKARTKFTREKKSTSFATTSVSSSPTKTQCPLKDGEHKIWQCKNFKKMKLADRHANVKKCNLCFSCLSTVKGLVSAKPIKLVAKMVAVSVSRDFCTVTTIKLKCRRYKIAIMRQLTFPTHFSQHLLVAEVCRLFP